MKLFPLPFTLAAAVLLTSACSDNSSDSDSDTEASEDQQLGVFLDSPVANLSYSSPSHSGLTSSQGGFEYTPGETTTFSYLGMELGAVTITADNRVVTPLVLAGTDSLDNQQVRNILVLLQSFDLDQNPDNGIELSTALSDYIGTIDLSSTDFQNAIATQYGYELVSEDDAVEHFEVTLAGLNNSDFTLTGSWAERSAGGEIESVLTFAATGELTARSFDDCNDNSEYIAATVQSAERNCAANNETYDWALTGNIIEISRDGDVLDQCIILRSSAFMFEATCTTDEFIHFERQITELSADLISSSYRNIANSGDSYSELTFGSDQQSGGYEYIDSESSDPSDTGTFSSWSASGQSLVVTGVDGADDSFSTTFTLERAFHGALQVDAGDEKSILIPDFDPDLVEMLTFRNLKVFDAITGKCKMIMLSTAEEQGGTTDSLVFHEPVNDEVCDINNKGAATPSGEQAYSFSIESADHVSIELGDYERRCDPITSIRSDDSGRYWFMACSTSTSDSENQVALEIWYNAY